MTDEFDRKYSRSIQELEGTSIWKSNYLPTTYRLQRLMGLRVKPPHYNSFLWNAVSLGLYFGLAWGALMWLLFWQRSDASVSAALLAALSAGLLFGLSMAAYYRWSARKHALSDWDEL